jgi:hypothetical protein
MQEREIEQKIYSISSKEEVYSHIVRCEGTNIWGDDILDNFQKYVLRG